MVSCYCRLYNNDYNNNSDIVRTMMLITMMMTVTWMLMTTTTTTTMMMMMMLMMMMTLEGHFKIFKNLNAPRAASNTYTEVARTLSCANHVQHTGHCARATCRVPRATCGQLSSDFTIPVSKVRSSFSSGLSSSLWATRCPVPCGPLAVQSPVGHSLSSPLWTTRCPVPCGPLAVQSPVDHLLSSPLWTTVVNKGR